MTWSQTRWSGRRLSLSPACWHTEAHVWISFRLSSVIVACTEPTPAHTAYHPGKTRDLPDITASWCYGISAVHAAADESLNALPTRLNSTENVQNWKKKLANQLSWVESGALNWALDFHVYASRGVVRGACPQWSIGWFFTEKTGFVWPQIGLCKMDPAVSVRELKFWGRWIKKVNFWEKKCIPSQLVSPMYNPG